MLIQDILRDGLKEGEDRQSPVLFNQLHPLILQNPVHGLGITGPLITGKGLFQHIFLQIVFRLKGMNGFNRLGGKGLANP